MQLSSVRPTSGPGPYGEDYGRREMVHGSRNSRRVPLAGHPWAEPYAEADGTITSQAVSSAISRAVTIAPCAGEANRQGGPQPPPAPAAMLSAG
jgi:hypothetical protein